MFPGFYIPTVFCENWHLARGMQARKCCCPVLQLSVAAAGSLSAGWHGCHLSLPTGIIRDRTETGQRGNRTGTGFMEETSFN